jgi:type I restriction enzyme, S subunit
MSDREKYKRAVKGDIAYNMMRMWQGAVGIAPVDGLVSPAYIVARPLNGVDPRYFSNLFRTSAYMSEVDSCSRGIVKDRNRLYWEDFKQIHSPYPPLEEQIRVAEAIEENTHSINHAIEQVISGISLLREYRTRLIADVVTGKLDVREAAASISQETEDNEAFEDALVEGEGLEDSEIEDEQAGESEEEGLT